MTQEEKRRIYDILRGAYAPGELIPPTAAETLLRDHGITAQALGYWRSRVMFEDMPEFITLMPRSGSVLLYDLTLAELAQEEPAPEPEIPAEEEPAPEPEVPARVEPAPEPEVPEADKQVMIGLLCRAFGCSAQVKLARAASVLVDYGYRASKYGISKGLSMIRQLGLPIETVVPNPDKPGNLDYLLTTPAAAPEAALPEVFVPTAAPAAEAPAPDTIPAAELSEADRRQVYRVLAEHLPFGVAYPLATVAHALNTSRWAPSKLGLKSTSLLLALGPLADLRSRGTDYQLTLNRDDGALEGTEPISNLWHGLTEEERAAAGAILVETCPLDTPIPLTELAALLADRQFRDGNLKRINALLLCMVGDGEDAVLTVEESGAQSLTLRQPMLRFARAVPESPAPAPKPEPAAPPAPDHPEPPTAWWKQVSFPLRPQGILASYVTGSTTAQLTPAMEEQVARDYLSALSGGSLVWEPEHQSYCFPLSYTTPEGYPLSLSLKVSTAPNTPPWWVNFVGIKREDLPARWEEPAPAPTPEPSVAPEVPATPEASTAEITAPAVSRLSEREKLEIYNTLVPLNPVGSKVLLSVAVSTLSTHGLTPQRYGYTRALQMLSDMPEYFHISSVRPKPDAPLVYSLTILPRPQSGDEPLFPVMDPATSEEPPFSMTERTIAFPLSQQGFLAGFINGGARDGELEKLSSEQITEFRNSYDAAVADGNLVYDAVHDCWRFPLTLTAKDGRALGATIKRSDRPVPPAWYVSFITKSNDKGIRPGQKLFHFAYLGNTTEFLRNLASHAEQESWGFTSDPDDYSILLNYITYTFYRLDYEGKVYIDPNGEFAAFNTGLLSRRFGRDLFAYFLPNTIEGKQKWIFSCFCSGTNEAVTPAERKAVAKLLPLELELPTFFTNLYDTMFDPSSKLESNFMHIVRDNLNRFPLNWLHKQCDDFPRTRTLLAQIEEVGAQARERKAQPGGASSPELAALVKRQKELFRELGEAVTDEDDEDMRDLLMDMNVLFEGAVTRTVQRCRRNFKLAVPCYFPTRNVMSMLLPISFSRSGNGAPCLALVAERQENSAYLGRTVLTMSMAYNDARLLCRPSSEWLNTEVIDEGLLEDDLDD